MPEKPQTDYAIDCAIDGRYQLAEGLQWNGAEETLYWVDAFGPDPRVLSFNPASGTMREWEMPMEQGSVVLREKGGAVIGTKTGFHFVDLETGRTTPIADPEDGAEHRKLNDGKCDRRGRYWTGSLDREGKGGGSLWRLDPDLSVHRMETGINTSNGIAFSPDDTVMYFADTPANTVWAYDFDIDSGAISNRREFISTREMKGMPDGATVDSEGYYWCAHFTGGQVARYDPTGRMVATIEMPVKHVTMCNFGGPGLETLYVSSGRKFLKPGEEERWPLSGSIFAVHGTGAKGLPEPKFAG